MEMYGLKNKKKIQIRMKDYYINNKEKISKKHENYYLINREKIAIQQKGYKRKQMKTNPIFRLGSLLRRRLLHAIRGNYKSGSAVQDLGCTIPELKFYLEGQFKDGMTWDNWTRVDLNEMAWNIDHKIPLVFFDLTDREQLLKAVHYTNLQPMWAKENLRKHNKIICHSNL